ncbi:MAG: hypothetical protein MZV70_39950, partial [Desulfobacterales bacterium]|nr:hypothetical protein [Desulfobacterales bacterium]
LRIAKVNTKTPTTFFSTLLDELGVAWQPSNMSFSLRCERSGLEYNGTSLNSLFAQRRNAAAPVVPAHDRATSCASTREAPAAARGTLDDALTPRRVPRARRLLARSSSSTTSCRWAAAIWSAEAAAHAATSRRASSSSFFDRHGFLSVDDAPACGRRSRGGSREYVRALLARRAALDLRLATPGRRRSAGCRARCACARRAATSSASTTCSSPATPTRRCALLDDAERRRSARCSARVPLRSATRRCCTPTRALLPRQPLGPGGVELPPARRTRRSRWRSPTT